MHEQNETEVKAPAPYANPYIAGIGLGASAIFAGLVPETLAVRTVSPPDATK